MAHNLTRRVVTSGLVVAPLVARSATAPLPLVPIISTFQHWDHHWYVWLPGDPTYEAVEVMAAERNAQAKPLIWVFFTERAVPKHQVHYFNDPQVAEATGALFRDIQFEMTGAVGEPRGVSVVLADQMNRSVKIGIQFDPRSELVTRGAGLTNQSGHAFDRLLLLFFREKNAFAHAWYVTIADVDVAKAQPRQNHGVPFPAAYSSNIFVSGFPFQVRKVAFAAERRPATDRVERFTPDAVPGNYMAILPDHTRLELVADSDGMLHTYRHRAGDEVAQYFGVPGNHLLRIEFTPALPAPNRIVEGAASTFVVSLDSFQNLVVGSARAVQRNSAILVDWRIARPAWASAHPLQSIISLANGVVDSVEVRLGV